VHTEHVGAPARNGQHEVDAPPQSGSERVRNEAGAEPATPQAPGLRIAKAASPHRAASLGLCSTQAG
jgi:hypothetical protein